MNIEEIYDYLKKAKVKKEVDLHNKIKEHLSKYPTEYSGILGVALQYGKLQDIFFLLNLEEYDFKNRAQIEPLHHLAKNNSLEKEQYQTIIQEILKRHEYKDKTLDDLLNVSNKKGVCVFVNAIYSGNLYFLSLIHEKNIALTASKPEFIHTAFAHLKSPSFTSQYTGTNVFQVQKDCLKLLDKIKLPSYDISQNTLNDFKKTTPLFNGHHLQNKKSLYGFKFYCEIFRKAQLFPLLKEHFFTAFSNIYSSHLAYTHKSNILKNVLVPFRKEELKEISAGKLLAYNIFHSENSELLTLPKIKLAIESDSFFLNNFVATLSSFYINAQNKTAVYSSLESVYNACQSTNQNIDNDTLLEIDFKGKNQVALIFLLLKGHKIDYLTKTHENNSVHYTCMDIIFQYSEDFIISEERMTEYLKNSNLFIQNSTGNYDIGAYYPDFMKAINNAKNIPTETVARTCISISNPDEKHEKSPSYKKYKELFLTILDNSHFSKSLKDETNDIFKVELNKYFNALLNFRDDSLFEENHRDHDHSFLNYFQLQISLMDKTLHEHLKCTTEQRKLFVSKAFEVYTSHQFNQNKKHTLFIPQLEKMLLNIEIDSNILEKETTLKIKKRL